VATLSDFLVTQAILWGLAAARLGGYVIASPFPGNGVPTTARVSLVVVLAWVVATSHPPVATAVSTAANVFGAGVLELLLGALVGFTFRLTLVPAELVGHHLSVSVGLNTGAVYNPMTDSQETALAKVVTLLALLVALGAGVHRVFLGALLESFHALPIGGGFRPDLAAQELVDVFIGGVVLSLRLAAPVLGILLVAQVALAFVARAAPALQIFNVGITVLLIVGMIAIGSSATTVFEGFVEAFLQSANVLRHVLDKVAP
jgi:flagellar biosynthetic protein FliR